jgi:hypothetical protein
MDGNRGAPLAANADQSVEWGVGGDVPPLVLKGSTRNGGNARGTQAGRVTPWFLVVSLLLLGDLLIPLGYLLAEFLNLTLLPLDLPLQFFPTWRMRLRMPTRRWLLMAASPSGSPIHPPYVKRFGEICPGKSTGILELSRSGLISPDAKTSCVAPVASPFRSDVTSRPHTA